MIRYWGATPVPWTVSWTGEEEFCLAPCAYAGGRLAHCQKEAWGDGKPRFAKPHMIRQRRAIALMLCDVCETPLKLRTKISLSQARPMPHSFRGWEILQVEPLLCKSCARLSIKHCPGLKRQIEAGIFAVRQVQRSEVQLAIMDEEAGLAMSGVARRAIGHAKVCLKKWIDRDAEWLGAAASEAA